ncbi:hypothetical protein [Thermoanaerobacterium aotearoense]|uniref:hypothetical protein n=1 Tax=Thermoanaerobacterium aotearoense TaxID=47490 RepID=UPI001F198C72|nr:hypothetical protein [Thermoanaerobacterium aotearoense]
MTFTAGCSKNSSNDHEEKSWAFSKIIILNGETYVGTSDDVTSIDKKIGTIKYFSTGETNINDTFFLIIIKLALIYTLFQMLAQKMQLQ